MKVFNKSFLILFIGLLASNVMGQSTYEDAVKLYNSAGEKAKAKNFDDAISSYKQAAEIGEQLGTAQGTDIKARSEQQIPKVYLNKAGNLFNAFRSSKQIPDLDIAISAFEKAVVISKEYGDVQVERRAAGYVPQLYFQKANMLFKRENYAGADEALDQAIRANANYAQPYYQKGLVAKKLDPENIDIVLRWFDQAIAVGTKTNRGQVVRQATKAAHNELLYHGASLIESGDYNKSIELLEHALNYDDESADVYYRLAEAHNKKGSYDNAIENANLALKYEQGGKNDKAKIYFELGLAYKSKNMKAEACSAYNDASFGSFREPAKYSMEYELKCKSTK